MSDPAAPPPNWLVRGLNAVPRVLASKPHVIALFALGVFLVVLPLAGVAVSARAELIGGNYTNVTSDIGACIAAGGTVTLLRRHRSHHEEMQVLRERIEALTNHLHATATPPEPPPAR